MSTKLSPVCILAGGLGRRLGARVEHTPKPLLPVAGEPFVFHQLRQLRQQGADLIVLCISYHGEQIARAVGDGSQFGLRVVFVHDVPKLCGTAEAVRNALPLLGDEFFVLYGDTYLRIDFADVQAVFRASGLPALMTVLHNEGRWDTSNAQLAGGLVRNYDKVNPAPSMQWIDYGLGMFSRRAFSLFDQHESDLAAVYQQLARRGLLAGYEASERFFEIGSPQALAETETFLRTSGSAPDRGTGRDVKTTRRNSLD